MVALADESDRAYDFAVFVTVLYVGDFLYVRLLTDDELRDMKMIYDVCISAAGGRRTAAAPGQVRQDRCGDGLDGRLCGKPVSIPR